MARAYGANASLLAAFEPSYGTPPSGTTEYWKLPFVSTSLGSEQGLIANDLIGLGRDPSAPIRDVIKVEGDMVVPIDLRNFGLWLKALLGAPVSTGDVDHQHTFGSGQPVLPSLALETGLPDIPAYFESSGVMVNSVQVKFARSGAADATLGLIAQGEVKQLVSVDATPQALGITRFNQFQGSIKKNGQALGNVVAAQLTILDALGTHVHINECQRLLQRACEFHVGLRWLYGLAGMVMRQDDAISTQLKRTLSNFTWVHHRRCERTAKHLLVCEQAIVRVQEHHAEDFMRQISDLQSQVVFHRVRRAERGLFSQVSR